MAVCFVEFCSFECVSAAIRMVRSDGTAPFQLDAAVDDCFVFGLNEMRGWVDVEDSVKPPRVWNRRADDRTMQRSGRVPTSGAETFEMLCGAPFLMRLALCSELLAAFEVRRACSRS